MSEKQFRLALWIISPKLNKRSTGADKGKPSMAQIVFQIQVTLKTVIEIQDTNYVPKLLTI